MNIRRINRRLKKRFGPAVTAALSEGNIVLSGRLPTWEKVIEACSLAAEKYSTTHVVNDIRCDEVGEQSIRMPTLRDTALEGRKPDVLIIGGGISGASIARELSKWKLDILLVEKEADLALQASGRNDGEVHPGIDLSRGSLKHHYVRRGNAMYDQLCRELEVPFKRVGQYVCFEKAWLKPLIALYCRIRKNRDGIADTELISGEELRRREPNLHFAFAISNPSSGCVCPYGLTIASVMDIARNTHHSKGGGILHTVHDNLLVGPDAIETWEKENTETHRESIDHVFQKQQRTMHTLSQGDIITYFTGVRAPTFEEDFIIEMGRKTGNILHCAGIQSPGLTTAPAVALDIEKMAVDYLSTLKPVEKNENYDPIRHGPPVLREMDDEGRAALIRQNPDYGIIICRCEEVSKGEILDALRSPIPVPTVDGIKKRVRPGMGRCQGGFCSPLVTQIIAEYLDCPLEEVRKSSEQAVITYGKTK